MDKTDVLTILVCITLVLTLVNLSATVNVFNKLNTGEVINAVPAGTAPQPAPTPARIQVSVDDDPVKGAEDAPVTIIEFSDFQCPFCARFSMQTLPLIDENYIETGRVRLVYRDFPLSGHEYAQKAAEAAECAEEQGKFWEYHGAVFEHQDALDDDSLKRYAKNLGLDMTVFNDCLDSGKMAPEVLLDLQEGSRYGVTGTPTFFINGIKVTGAQPFGVFQQIIEQELNAD